MRNQQVSKHWRQKSGRMLACQPGPSSVRKKWSDYLGNPLCLDGWLIWMFVQMPLLMLTVTPFTLAVLWQCTLKLKLIDYIFIASHWLITNVRNKQTQLKTASSCSDELIRGCRRGSFSTAELHVRCRQNCVLHCRHVPYQSASEMMCCI